MPRPLFDFLRIDRHIWLQQLLGKSDKQIADDLNTEDLLTIKGKQWDAKSVRRRMRIVRLFNKGSKIWGVRFNVTRQIGNS